MALRTVGIDDTSVRGSSLPEGVACDDDGQPTGWLWRLDKWLGARVPGVELDLDALSMNAARLGITGFTDATVDRSEQDACDLVASILDRSVRQRLHLMCPIDVTPPRHERVTHGPVKVMLDDVDPPSVQTLSRHVRERPRSGSVGGDSLRDLVTTRDRYRGSGSSGGGWSHTIRACRQNRARRGHPASVLPRTAIVERDRGDPTGVYCRARHRVPARRTALRTALAVSRCFDAGGGSRDGRGKRRTIRTT